MKKSISYLMLIDDDAPTKCLNQITINETKKVEEFICFENAEESIAFLQRDYLLKEKKLDYIILDLNMPKFNGFDFLEAYASMEAEKKGKGVIVLSDSEDPNEVIKALSYDDVIAFYPKPLTAKIIEELVVMKHSFFLA